MNAFVDTRHSSGTTTTRILGALIPTTGRQPEWVDKKGGTKGRSASNGVEAM